VFWELLSEHLIVHQIVELRLNLSQHRLLDLGIVPPANTIVNPATDHVQQRAQAILKVFLRARLGSLAVAAEVPFHRKSKSSRR